MSNPTTITPEDCRTIEGHDMMTAVAWWIFGDDLTANTDERIGHTVGQWCPTTKELRAYVLAHVGCDTYYDGWKNREGQPYQADLEAHVAAWRADPPKETNDLAVSMFDEGMPLRARRLDPVNVETAYEECNMWIVWKGVVSKVATGPTFSTAVFRAALIRAVTGNWKRKELSE